MVNKAETPAEPEALARSVNRGPPYGGVRWAARTAGHLGLEATMRPRGRPRMTPEK